MAKKSITLTTFSDLLTVNENSGFRPIGIKAPSDSQYPASKLTVTVTGLPTDGTVFLSDRVTRVFVGERLTVTQLTSLLFQPTNGLFGTSSGFTYSVTDPSGTKATGSATLTIGPDIMPPVTTAAMLSVAGNSAPTPIGIAVPTDPNYGPSQLTVTVTGLPGGGMIFLSDGVTQVTLGEKLTVGQLTGLMFEPNADTFNASFTFSYKVTDPAGLSATGSATLAIAADSQPPITIDPTLTVLPNSGPIAIGIPAPTDPNYPASSLTVTVTGLPTDGTVLLSDGVTAVTAGETLTVLQLTGLMFTPTPGLSGQSSDFTYTVTDPAGLSTGGVEILVISSSSTSPTSNLGPVPPGSGLWQDPAFGAVPAAGIDLAPRVQQPSQAGDLVGVRLQNNSASVEPSGYVSFGQVFLPGAVHPGDSLVARISGVNYAVQMNVESTNADGSVRQAVLTLGAPAIAAGGTLDLMLAIGTAAGPSPAAPSPAALFASGYNVGVNFTFHNSDGTTTLDSASGAAALQAAINSGTVRTLLSGPGMNEYDVVTTVDGGKLKVEFDIRAYANGTTSTDVIFDNSWMFSPGHTNLNYDVSISQGGQQIFSATGVQQYLYSLWDHQVASPGTINPNVQYDVAYLEATGAIPSFDTSFGVSDATIQAQYSSLNATNTGPMGSGLVTTSMGMGGGRYDIGPQTNWVAQWLMSQNSAASMVMMANASASGAVPWHFTDESTGAPVSQKTYPNFWEDTRASLVPANGWPQYGSSSDPWSPDSAHLPDLNYLPYLTTGSHYQLELLQAEANYAIASTLPGFGDTTWALPATTFDSFVGDDIEQRGIAWDLREVAEAAYITPDSDPTRAYFVSELQANMHSLVQQYVVNGADAPYGELTGFIQGYGPNWVAPFEQNYIVTSLAAIAGMNIPQASADAVTMLNYMTNFIAGLFTNGSNGYAPLDGPAFWLQTADPTTGALYTTWSQLYQGNVALGHITPQTTEFAGYQLDTQGGLPEIARAALADLITYTQSPQAIQAYGYVVSQIAYAFDLAWGSPAAGKQGEIAAYQTNLQWSEMPRLPDGVWLQNSQMQIDTSGASQVSLTAAGGDSLLAVVGGGTATLTGGNGGVDLFYGGSGPTTLVAGTGNDYLFGGSGTTTFVDNIGNNYMHGGTGANTYRFAENASGHDTIANFNVGTDQLRVAPNLNGSGITSAAQLVAGATVSNGNTVLHLSSNDDITLLHVSQPSILINSILVS